MSTGIYKFIFVVFLAYSISSCTGEVDIPDKNILAQVSRGEVQSCEGCQLNRLPNVKAFIFNDIQTYNNIVFKPIPGAPPQLVLFNESNEEISRINLGKFNREECNDLLKQWGFKLKSEDESNEDSSDESSREEL